MAITPSPLSRPREDTHDLTSLALFRYRSNDLALDTVRGDQAPTLVSANGGKGARDKMGRLRTIAAGVERFHMMDTDGDGIFETPVLLLERGVTQFATAPEDLTNGAYILSEVTVAANAIKTPNGQLTADKIVETTATARHFIRQNVGGTVTDNAVTTGAWLVRAAERTWAAIESVNKAGASATSYFNLTTGLWGTTAGSHAVRAEKWFGGWYRLFVSVNMASGGSTPSFAVGTATGDGVDSFAGSTSSGLYVWGWRCDTNRAATTSYPDVSGGETLQWAYDGLPQPMTVYVRGVDLGTIAENVGLLDIGGNVGANPRFTLGASGGFYRAILHNGTTSVTRTLGVAPSVGQWVELRAVLAPVANSLLNEVTVDLGQAIDGGAEVTVGPSGAIALPSAWAAALVTPNQLTNEARGMFGFRDIGIWSGVRTLAELRGLL